MRAKQILIVSMTAALLGAGIAGCEQQGPAERAGEKIDEAASDAKAGVEEAASDARAGVEQAADKVEDAADKLEDKVDGK